VKKITRNKAGYLSKKRETMNNLSNTTKKILIVDDEMGKLITLTDECNGTYIYMVNDGYHAMELVQNMDFELILVDINLNNPMMDGLKVMRCMRNLKHGHKLTIYGMVNNKAAEDWYIKEGFNGLILKSEQPQFKPGLLQQLLSNEKVGMISNMFLGQRLNPLQKTQFSYT
jgi:CheY-like chemotaxis protein